MRILHIVPLISEKAEYGGPVRGTLRQSVSFAQLGNRVTVLALWKGVRAAPVEMWGIPLVLYPFHRLPGHRFAGAISARALIWIRRNGGQFDVVHIHAGRDLWVLLAMALLRTMNVPYVWQTHGMLSPRPKLSMRVYDFLLTRPALSASKEVLFLTDFERRELKLVESTLSRLRLIVNGVDSPERGVAPSVGSSSIRAIFVSRLHERKRLADLIVAIGELRDHHSVSIFLDFYGPDEGALQDALALIRSRDLGDQVKYGGVLDYDQVRSRLLDYNVFVMPSINEPFPNALLEAMASGLICITTESCGLAPYIKRAEAGVVVSPGVSGLTEGLLRIQQDPVSSRLMAERALRLCATTFSMEAVATELAESYQS